MTSNYTRLGRAIALAAEVHQDQVDKAGEPYILHCLAVMTRARDYYLANSDGWKLTEVEIVAVLHDTLEDLYDNQAWAHGRLASRIYQEFGSEVSSAVDALTKQKGPGAETYDEYLGRVERNWMARIVKIADLSHNMDPFRMPIEPITEEDMDRWDKYRRAIVRLKHAEPVR